jgi:hypothetical protein
MSNLYAASTAALTLALHSAHPGDVIRLAPETYSNLAVNGVTVAGGAVTVVSADPKRPAVLTNFNILDSQGLTFKDLDFSAAHDSRRDGAFRVERSQDITFDHDVFHGPDGSVVDAPAIGLNLRNSSHVAVLDSEFRDFVLALAVSSVTDALVEHSSFHDIRSDGIDGTASGPVKIIGNHFSDFYPKESYDASGKWLGGDHPDAIQFWTALTPAASHDIEIRDNVIERGSGPQAAAIQGIFLTDQTKGALAYRNVTITHNLVIGPQGNGITLMGGHNVTVTDNDIYPYPDHKTWFRYADLDGQTLKNNTVHGTVTDNGAAARAERAKHPNPGRLER